MTHAPLFIVSGPAGGGKTSLVERVLREDPHPLHVSVSATTRPPRPGEMDGVHYHFWTPARFEEGVRKGEFLEHAQVHGRHRYGTLRREVDDNTARGRGVILVIDVQGAAAVRAQRPDAVTLFLQAPSLEEYERRLVGRGDDAASIAVRLKTARAELERVGEYQYVIVNDDLARAAAEFRGVIARHFERKGDDGCSTN
jgi:guanylate kinase